MREKSIIIDCSQQTEMLPYIRRVLLQIGSCTVAMASLSPAPAFCTPALHRSQAKRSASLGSGSLVLKTTFSIACFHTLFFCSSSTTIILVTNTTFDLLPCQSPNHSPTLNLTLPLPRLSTQSLRYFIRHQPRISRACPCPAASHSQTS
jgi:hypothetical protein